MGYRLITTIQVYEGDSREIKPTEDVSAGSKLKELDTGNEFIATLLGSEHDKVTWKEDTDSQLTTLGSQLVSLNRSTEGLLIEMKRANLIAETVHGVEVSVEDVDG